MSGLEIPGLVLGGVSLVLQSLGLLLKLKQLLAQYDSFDRTLRCATRKIDTADSIFREAVDLLLSDVLDEDCRKKLLRDVSSVDLNIESVEVQLAAVLGISYKPLKNSLQGFKEDMEQITAIFERLGEECAKHPAAKEKVVVNRLARRMAGILVSTANPHVQLSKIQSPSQNRKLWITIKGTAEELKSLQSSLMEHNSNLRSLITFRVYRRFNTPQSVPQLHQPALCAQTTVSHVVNESPSDNHKFQNACRKLHGIICNSITCDCHLLYLRLDRSSKDMLDSGAAEEPKKHPIATAKVVECASSNGPKAQFSFLLTKSTVMEEICRTGPITASEPYSGHQPVYRLVFSTYDADSAHIPGKHTASRTTTICQEIVASDAAYERYFLDDSIGFVLRLEPQAGTDLAHPEFNSLDHLITSSESELNMCDRFQIAANLLNSVLTFYSSAWIQDWTPRSIEFPKKLNRSQVTASPTEWTPYLSVPAQAAGEGAYECQFGVRNREVYALGLILLQLGRKRRLIRDAEEDEETMIKKAIGDLHRKIGPEYTKVVEKCLYDWSDRKANLMEKSTLEDFCKHSGMMEQWAEYFQYPLVV